MAAALSIANLNYQAWVDYVNGNGQYPLSQGETTDMRKGFARFVLVNICTSAADMHLYIHDYELIQFVDDNNELKIVKAKDAPDKCYRFTPDNLPKDSGNGIRGGGTITGPVGVWDTRAYRFQKFMKTFGIWILFAFFVFVLFMLRRKGQGGGKGGGRSVGGGSASQK